MKIISSLLGTLFFRCCLSFGLEASLFFLLATESDLLLETRELGIDFLNELLGQMEVLSICQQGLHVTHLSDHGIQLNSPVRGGERRLLLLLLLLYLFLLGWSLLALLLGIKDLHLGVFTLGIVKKHLKDLASLNVP